VHSFVNNLERSIGTYLYGRRLYDVMVLWETTDTGGQPPYIAEYAKIWRSADKVVFSTTLQRVSSTRTRIERDFNAEAIRKMKDAAVRDISVGGAVLAAEAIKARLVDEIHLFLTPVIVGGGKHALPQDVRLNLDLIDERRFGNGVVHVRYRLAGRGFDNATWWDASVSVDLR